MATGDLAPTVTIAGGKAFRVRVYQQELFEEAKRRNVRLRNLMCLPLEGKPPTDLHID